MTNLDIFTPIRLGDYTLPNRIIMAPLTRMRAGVGNVPTQMNATYYTQRAAAGLIITEATQVSLQGRGYARSPGIHSLEQIAGWRLVTDAVLPMAITRRKRWLTMFISCCKVWGTP